MLSAYIPASLTGHSLHQLEECCLSARWELLWGLDNMLPQPDGKEMCLHPWSAPVSALWFLKGNCSDFFIWKPWWVDAEESVWWHVCICMIALISSFFFLLILGGKTQGFLSVFFFCLSVSQVTFTTVLSKHASWFRTDKLLLQGNARVNFYSGREKQNW